MYKWIARVADHAVRRIGGQHPTVYGALYFLNVWIFGLLYCFCIPNGFTKEVDFVVAMYFSIATATTLGYGDISPLLDNPTALILVSTEVLIGVALIGLFLNSLSHKISMDKEAADKRQEERRSADQIERSLVMLRPVINQCLHTLSTMYKFTAQEEMKAYKVRPKDLLDAKYCDQICSMDFFAIHESNIKQPMFKFFIAEHERFSAKLDNYLSVFSHALPVTVLVVLTKIKEHHFLQMPMMYSSLYFYLRQLQGSHAPLHSPLVISSGIRCQEVEYVSEFNKLLLEIIEEIDKGTPEDPVTMTVSLRNDILPRVGAGLFHKV